MVKLYRIVRDWVDRRWRDPGLAYKVLLLPAIIPLLCLSLAGVGKTSLPFGLAWFALWSAFVLWRYWFYLKELARQGDEQFDQEGKFRLSHEYHDSESATAAAKRRKNERESD